MRIQSVESIKFPEESWKIKTKPLKGGRDNSKTKMKEQHKMKMQTVDRKDIETIAKIESLDTWEENGLFSYKLKKQK